jgi:hypothetical protein
MKGLRTVNGSEGPQVIVDESVSVDGGWSRNKKSADCRRWLERNSQPTKYSTNWRKVKGDLDRLGKTASFRAKDFSRFDRQATPMIYGNPTGRPCSRECDFVSQLNW